MPRCSGTEEASSTTKTAREAEEEGAPPARMVTPVAAKARLRLQGFIVAEAVFEGIPRHVSVW